MAEQLAGVAQRYYEDLPDGDLVVLVLDEAALGVPVVDEAAVPGGERFPHVYGPIPLAAVLDAAALQRDGSGRVIPPP